MALFFRISKSVLLALIMFFSLRYLEISYATAITVSLIPLLLGSIGVLTSFSYMLAALVFIVACASSLLPELNINAGDLFDHVKSEADFRNMK